MAARVILSFPSIPFHRTGAQVKSVLVATAGKRLTRAFPELKGIPLRKVIDGHSELIRGSRLSVDVEGLTGTLWNDFEMQVTHEQVFRLALLEKISAPLLGIVIPRPAPKGAVPFSAASRAARVKAVSSILERGGKLNPQTIATCLAEAQKMPDAYFMTCTAEEIAGHLEQMALQGEGQTIHLEARGREIFIVPDPDRNIIPTLERIARDGKSVKRARFYMAEGGGRGIFIFNVGEQGRMSPADRKERAKASEFRKRMLGENIVVGGKIHQISAEEIDSFVRALSYEYLRDASLGRLQHHLGLFIKARYDQRTVVEVEPSPLDNSSRVTLVGANIPRVGFLASLVRILSQHGLDLRRVFVETMESEATTKAVQKLSLQGREPIRAIVETLRDDKEPSRKSTAERAVTAWAEDEYAAKVIATQIRNLNSEDLQARKKAFDTLVSIGTRVQEAVAINTFYVVKKTGEPLDEVRDAHLIQRLKDDFQAAPWAFGGELGLAQTAEISLRPRQASLAAAAASFVAEMFSYRGLESTPCWGEVGDIFLRRPTLVRLFVDRFEAQFNPYFTETPYVPRDKLVQYLEAEITAAVTELPNDEREVFQTALAFVSSVRATNYFGSTNSLAFSLSPDFISGISGLRATFPHDPFGIFYVCGLGFRGLHVRFEDIARGGIRVVPSPSMESYQRNAAGTFGEVYRLSWTQNYKNIKGEIPEGGSKGVVVLQPGVDPVYAFKSYLDGLLDLIRGTRTLLFLGPDENSGDLMDLGADQAARRGYLYPGTFTTGKSAGIPHDKFGITTTGIYEYEQLVFADLGLREEALTKVLTGGPDGDLGSNEIRVTRARIIAVVDGSGAAYDSEGLDKDELLRLADARTAVASFDRNKLHAGASLIPADDQMHTLPDGREVRGRDFRDSLIFEVSADILLPAGGRPQTIHAGNVQRLLKTDGTPKYRIIVEGANVFITQEARLFLEEKGVIIIKDSSANKGGVMSSSHEVLAAFLLDSAEFQAIYGQYVEQVKERIRASVRREYALLKALKGTLGSYSAASDKIGEEMKALFHKFMAIDLPDDPAIDALILSHLMPAIAERLGREETIARIRGKIPPAYRKAIVAARLAYQSVRREGLGYLAGDEPLTQQTLIAEAKKILGQKQDREA